MSESQHRRGDAQDRTGVRQTRPSGTRQARPSGANGTRRPSSSGNPKKRRKRRKKRSVNSRIGKVLLIVAIVIAFAVAGAILGTVFGILQSTDMLNTSDVLPDSYTSVIYDADDNEVDKLHGEENREYVKLSAITTNMQNAVIAIEDQRFYEHNGIDIRGIMRAMAENIKTMSFSQGASTLTQQVLKNEVLEREKSLSRKIKVSGCFSGKCAEKTAWLKGCGEEIYSGAVSEHDTAASWSAWRRGGFSILFWQACQ